MRRTPPVLLLLGVLAPCLVHGQPAVRPTGVTPPRLALVEGTASFWRPGASDWSRAVVNTPLGAGDALFAERDSTVEVQVGPAAYLRLAATTYVELSDVAAEHLQVKLVRGEASLDLRELMPRSVEVDTPHAAFTLDRPGYYRLHVDSRSATLIVRRGGGAMLTPGNAPSDTVRSGEEVVVESDGAVHHFAAPDLDAWDQWSLARSDRLLDALSARFVADGVYGVADLDQAGSWREVPEYGAVWLPDAVPAGWTPFSTGQWIYDTTFGWSWIDDAPWGWAPFHHGRWVSVDGRWAWAPGPPDVVPAYAPAVVGWLEGGPGIGWVPLGWGEPIFPWWGPSGATGVASWAGWGGPWFVNRAPIQQRGSIYASSMNYVNASIPGAVVATRADRLGRGEREHTRTTPGDVALMRPRDAGPGVNPVANSLLPTTERGTKPGSSLTQQRVRATRMPPDAGARLRELGLKVPGTAVVHLVLQPPRMQPSTGDRPPEVAAAGETPAAPERAGAGDQERARPPRAPGFIDWLNGVEAAEAASRRVPRDLFASPYSGESAWRSNRGFEPPMGEPYRTDLPGEPGMRLRPSGGAAGFAVAEGERKEPSASAPPPRAAPPPPPPVAVAMAPTTSSTMVVPPTTIPPTYAPPTVTTTTYALVTTSTEVASPSLLTTSTVVTTTTLAAPPPIVSAPPAEFQPCAAVGDTCGPCGARGEMAACMRQIGKLTPICALPETCLVMDCLWDSDCGVGRRCVQNAQTLQTNCCDECTEVVREHMPRYVTLSSTTTTVVVPAPAPTYAPAPPPTWAPAPPPTSAPPTYAPVTSTTIYVSAPPQPTRWAAPAFRACTAAGAECGPCPPGNRMSKCARRMGSESFICAQPDTCFASWCVWDQDCGPGRRCVLNPDTLQTNCCQECKGLGDDDLFDVVTTTTTTTLPPSGSEFDARSTTTTLLPPGFEPCAFTGDLCGPCEPNGFMSTCHREIGSTQAFCPKPGSCVEITCESNADCLSHQRCVFNNNTMLSNCCEACVPAAAETPPATVETPSTTSTTVRRRQSIF